MSGRGTVYTYSVNGHDWFGAGETEYVVAIVELDEQAGLHLTTNIVGCASSEVAVGMAVLVEFEQHDDAWLPIFRPEL
jgi:uncharacterized OB-fold protein